MMPPKIILDLEITQTADELIIRTHRNFPIVFLAAAFVLGPLSFFLPYHKESASWNRAGSYRFEVAWLIFQSLPFVIVPLGAAVYYGLKRRRPWVFDRRSGQLTRTTHTRGDQRWPLASFNAVAIDVRLRKGIFGLDSAGVVLHFDNDVTGEADTLELARFPAGRQRSLAWRINEATDLANTIADFLGLPALPAPPPKRGFEVIQPASSPLS